MVSDVFSYVYAKAIHKALELIEKEINDGKDPQEKWSASNRPLLLKRDLPEPIECEPEYCTVDEAPGCLNFEVSLWIDPDCCLEGAFASLLSLLFVAV